MPRRVLPLLALFAGLFLTRVSAQEPVAIIADAPWSPGDAPRDGAAELDVLVRLAALQRTQPCVGLVGIGDRRGLFQEGTQRAFEFAAQRGVPVVRLARGHPLHEAGSEDWFIDGGRLAPEAAATLLAHCLSRFGPLPKLSRTDAPPPAELRAFRAKLRLYQAEFTSRQPAMVAMR